MLYSKLEECRFLAVRLDLGPERLSEKVLVVFGLQQHWVHELKWERGMKLCGLPKGLMFGKLKGVFRRMEMPSLVNGNSVDT